MKNIKQLIRNIYRIYIVKPGGRNVFVNFREPFGEPVQEEPCDARLRELVAGDELSFEADPGLRETLRQRVANNGHRPVAAKNSLLDIFLPVFSLRHIELNMALICLVLFVLIGFGPKNTQRPGRNTNPVFLADSLRDTTVLDVPALPHPLIPAPSGTGEPDVPIN
jgi:hypothetical protein